MNTIKIGKQIAALRREAGYTQERLAEILGISPQAVSKWENGRALPETALLPGLATALSTTIDSILTENKLQILSAFFGDGINSACVSDRLNKLIQNNALSLRVTAPALSCPEENERPHFLIIKYQIEDDIFYTFAEENGLLLLDLSSKGFVLSEKAEIIAAVYGTARAKNDVMHKIEHYKVFNWDKYSANHETFPSDPNNDDTDYLTFVYLNGEGIHMVTCEEDECIAYNAEKTELFRKQELAEHFIKGVPVLPEFGKGWDCSWGAALTAALQGCGFETTYEQVMGVSGACYRLAFCSPGWDYSSVDGLVAYDYSTPGYKAFGFVPRLVDRIEKEARAEERKTMVTELRHNMPVLGINLRVAAEWGVICGYKNNGSDLFCRTKYDIPTINKDSDFLKGHPEFKKELPGPHDYMPVDNWPFIISYFGSQTARPTEKENLLNSLRVFVDSLKQTNNGGYYMGFMAYQAWRRDLLDELWYKTHSSANFARRFSVNQFCTLALYDARRAAFEYLKSSAPLLPEHSEAMAEIIGLFKEISEKAAEIHAMLDSGECLEGKAARKFWKRSMRERQAALLDEMCSAEEKAMQLAETIV